MAIERLNRPQNRLDLLFADADTGKSQTAFTEQDKYWINISDDLRFLADDKRFLWSSERSGFRHLYLYDLAGKQLAQLTQRRLGSRAASHGIDEQNGQVYFTSTEQSPIERQFYRVSAAVRRRARATNPRPRHPRCRSRAGHSRISSTTFPPP